MDNKILYKQLCNNNLNIPLFNQYWWLDAVCGPSNWNVVLYINNNNNILGAFPYYLKKKFYFKTSINPPFTSYIGPWIHNSIKNDYEISSITNYLINELPKFNYIDLKLDYNSNNWLPFYWNGYLQTDTYSIVIKNLIDNVSVIKKFNDTNKRMIKKAEKKKLKFCTNVAVDEFYKNHTYFLKKLGKKINYDFISFKILYELCKENKCGSSFAIKDQNDNVISIAFIVWDHHTSYMILNSTDTDHRNTGCTQFLIKNILNYLKNTTKCFNFEGSMDKNIFNFYRSFGGEVLTYNRVVKYSSLFFKLIIPQYITLRNKQLKINQNTMNFIEV